MLKSLFQRVGIGDISMPFRKNNEEIIEGINAGKWILEEQLIGYKMVLCKSANSLIFVYAIATLAIPKGATVIRPIEYKGYLPYIVSNQLRTNETKTIKIIAIDNEQIEKTNCHSIRDSKFKYDLGTIQKTDLDEDITKCCTFGIHFFTDREYAENYCII